MSDALIAKAALAAAVAWGTGLRLYAVAMVLGLLGRHAGFELPDTLQWLSHPLAVGLSALLTLAGFVGDSGGAAQALATLLGGGLGWRSPIRSSSWGSTDQFEIRH